MPTVDRAAARASGTASRPPPCTLAERRQRDKDAVAELHAFHRQLAPIRVLDPACGSGNFLYVTLEHSSGWRARCSTACTASATTSTACEMPTATPSTRTSSSASRSTRAPRPSPSWCSGSATCNGTSAPTATRDAARAGAPRLPQHRVPRRRARLRPQAEHVIDERRRARHPLGRRTTKTHPVTGEEVPDESARVPVCAATSTRARADWPQADYVVGNPPFIGNWRMRGELGDGYTETLRRDVPRRPGLGRLRHVLVEPGR